MATKIADLLGYPKLSTCKERSPTLKSAFSQHQRAVFGVQRLKLQPHRFQNPLHVFTQTRRNQDRADFAVGFGFDGFDVFGELQGVFFGGGFAFNFDYDEFAVFVFAVDVYEARFDVFFPANRLETHLRSSSGLSRMARCMSSSLAWSRKSPESAKFNAWKP